MRFKSDRQRKAVMAQYNSGNHTSNTRPIPVSNKPMLPSERRKEIFMKRQLHVKQKEDWEKYKDWGKYKKDSDKGLALFKTSKKGKAIIAKDLKKTRWETEDYLSLNKAERRVYDSMKRDGRKHEYILKTLGYDLDSDRDGVPDSKDCEPFNPRKQGLLHKVKIKMLRRQEEKLERQREKALRNLEDTKDKLHEKRAIADKKATISQLKLKQKQAIIDETNREKKRINEIKQANIEAKRQLDEITISGKAKRIAKRAGAAAGAAGSRVARQAAADSKLAFQRTAAFVKKGGIQKTLKKINKFIPG